MSATTGSADRQAPGDASGVINAVAAATPPPPSWRRRARAWTGIFAAYFSAQTATQLLGILAGLVFIRTMPVAEFALYTLGTSFLTFFAFATDLGSTGSLVHFFQRAARGGDDFERYVASVLGLRRSAFAAGALVVAVALPLAAAAKEFAILPVVLTTAAVLVATGLQIVSSVRVLTLRLHDRYGQSYRAELAGAALRLVLALSMVAAAMLEAWLALMTAAAASAVVAWLARRDPAAQPRVSGAIDLRPYRRAVLRYLLPTLPSALYFAVQGPLIVWLAAAFGATRNIAEVGALTRLGLLVGIFSGLTGVVFLPRLARILDEAAFRRRALQFGTVHLVLATALLAAAWAVPQIFLWLLGPQYAGLHRELLLVVAGAGLTLLGGYVVSVNLARCWTRWESAAVAVLAACQAVAVAALPMSTTTGVLTFNLVSAAVGLGLQLIVAATGFSRPSWVLWKIAPISPAS